MWGNTDSANSKPLFPYGREVRPVTSMTTANITTAGANTIVFTANLPSTLVAGLYAYSLDANNSVSRFFDTSIVDQNDVDFYRANNFVARIDTVNNLVRLANNTVGTLPAGQTVYFGTAVPYSVNKQSEANYANNMILVTPTRLANSLIGASKTGNFNVGWNEVTRKVNNDGTERFLRECLVALASPVAANVSSANTSSNAVFGGL